MAASSNYDTTFTLSVKNETKHGQIKVFWRDIEGSHFTPTLGGNFLDAIFYHIR